MTTVEASAAVWAVAILLDGGASRTGGTEGAAGAAAREYSPLEGGAIGVGVRVDGSSTSTAE